MAYGISFLAGDADDGGEAGSCRATGGEFVEDVAHRAREYTFDFLDL
jgi:hypothetical protein